MKRNRIQITQNRNHRKYDLALEVACMLPWGKQYAVEAVIVARDLGITLTKVAECKTKLNKRGVPVSSGRDENNAVVLWLDDIRADGGRDEVTNRLEAYWHEVYSEFEGGD